jgi:hypothetical protein
MPPNSSKNTESSFSQEKQLLNLINDALKEQQLIEKRDNFKAHEEGRDIDSLGVSYMLFAMNEIKTLAEKLLNKKDDNNVSN